MLPELGRPAQWAIVAVLLANMAIQMVAASLKDSPTYDEIFHIGAAVEKYHGSLQWGADHPPVAHLLIGLPLKFVDFPEPEFGAEQIQFDGYVRGRDLMYQKGEAFAQRVLQLARLPVILFTLGVMLVVFLFARDLFGFWGGAAALLFASANPTVLAHGRLATTDMVVSGLVLITIWMLWRAGGSPNRRWILLGAAVVFGLALATKYSALAMFPFVLVVAVWAVLRQAGSQLQIGVLQVVRQAGGRSRANVVEALVGAFLFAVISISTVWAVYLAIDPGLDYSTREKGPSTELAARLGDLMPLPEPFQDGLRLQAKWDAGTRVGFLFGEKYLGGRPLFYPASLVMKSPLALLIAAGLGLYLWVAAKRSLLDLAMLLLVPGTFFLFAMTTGTNLGIRHILVVPLFMALLAGGLATKLTRGWVTATAVLGAWALAATWLSFPNHLAYVNEAFGGSGNAYKLVGDSNVDWGQDLIRLRDYLEEHPQTEQVWLVYFGQAPVEKYGLPVEIAGPEDAGRIAGTLAISVSRINNLIPGPYDGLVKDRRPFAQVGHSILLYRIPPGAAPGGVSPARP